MQCGGMFGILSLYQGLAVKRWAQKQGEINALEQHQQANKQPRQLGLDGEPKIDNPQF